MSRVKTHVNKGDLVEVITGDHKGVRGTVLQVVVKDPKKGARVLVEGVNMIKKAMRSSQDKPQGGFIEREGTVHISNVKLIEHEKKEKKGKKEKK